MGVPQCSQYRPSLIALNSLSYQPAPVPAPRRQRAEQEYPTSSHQPIAQGSLIDA
jgi:hypothetical protein